MKFQYKRGSIIVVVISILVVGLWYVTLGRFVERPETSISSDAEYQPATFQLDTKDMDRFSTWDWKNERRILTPHDWMFSFDGKRLAYAKYPDKSVGSPAFVDGVEMPLWNGSLVFTPDSRLAVVYKQDLGSRKFRVAVKESDASPVLLDGWYEYEQLISYKEWNFSLSQLWRLYRDEDRHDSDTLRRQVSDSGKLVGDVENKGSCSAPFIYRCKRRVVVERDGTVMWSSPWLKALDSGDGMSQLEFDGADRHIAYVITDDVHGERVAIGNTVGKFYDAIERESLRFSADGRYVAYGAMLGTSFYFVVEEVPNSSAARL